MNPNRMAKPARKSSIGYDVVTGGLIVGCLLLAFLIFVGVALIPLGIAILIFRVAFGH